MQERAAGQAAAGQVVAGQPATGRRLEIEGTELLVLADEAAVAREAASRTVAALGDAIRVRGVAHLALTGGSAAIPLYRELAGDPWRHAISWEQVHLWWGDERFVPRDHPESNAGLAYRILLGWAARVGESGSGGEGVDIEAGDLPGLTVDAGKVHAVLTEEAIGNGQGPLWAAQMYAEEIGRLVPVDQGGVPAFDVVLLGVGPDGHTLSVFRDSPALADDAPIVLAADAPTDVEPHLARITLAPRFLRAAGVVLVMSAGPGKSDVLARVLGEERDVARWPAQAALLPNSTWLLDEEAARDLPRERQDPT